MEDNITFKTKNDEFLTNTLSQMKSRENDIENFLIEADEKNANSNSKEENTDTTSK